MTTITANISTADQTQLDDFRLAWHSVDFFGLMNQDLTSIRSALANNTATYITRNANQVIQSAGTGTVTLNGSGFITTGPDIAGVGTIVTSVVFADSLGRNLLTLNGSISMASASTSLGINSLRIGDIARGGEMLLTGNNLGFTQTDIFANGTQSPPTGSHMTLTGSLSSIVTRQRIGTEEYQTTLTGTLTLSGAGDLNSMTGNSTITTMPNLGTGSLISSVTINRLVYPNSTVTTGAITTPLLSLSGLTMDTLTLSRLTAAVQGDWQDPTFGAVAGAFPFIQVFTGTDMPTASRMQRLDDGTTTGANNGKILLAEVFEQQTPQFDQLGNYIGTTSSSATLRVARFNADGTVDTTYGTNGQSSLVLTPPDANHQFMLSNINPATGDLLVTQASSTNGGNIDQVTTTLFNANGTTTALTTLPGLTIPLSSVVGVNLIEQVDMDINHIVQALLANDPTSGNQTLYVTRRSADGSMDPAFGTGGLVTNTLGATSFMGGFPRDYGDGSGRVLVVLGDSGATSGTPHFTLMRYTNTGLDTSFGDVVDVINNSHTGSVNSPSPPVGVSVPPAVGFDVKTLADGRILVVVTNQGGWNGVSNYAPSVDLLRYTAAGALDTSFGTGGHLRVDVGDPGNYIAPTFHFDPDGKLLVASSGVSSNAFDPMTGMPYSSLSVARFNADGTPDTSFGNGSGVVNTTVNVPGLNVGQWSSSDSTFHGALASQPDGSVVIDANTPGSGSVIRIAANGDIISQSSGNGVGGISANYVVDPTTGAIVIASIDENGNFDPNTGLPLSGSFNTKLSRLTPPPLVGDVLSQGVLAGNDSISLNIDQSVTLNGYAGNDILTAGSGSDNLDGGTGNDNLDGGLGNDTLTGGEGADRFVFSTTLGSSNVDTITDFNAGVGQDKIFLTGTPFAGVTFNANGSLPSSTLSTDGAITGDTRIIYDASTGVLSYDEDGTGTIATQPFAILGTTTHPTLTASDFTTYTASLTSLSNGVMEGNSGSTPFIFNITRSGTDAVQMAWELTGSGNANSATVGGPNSDFARTQASTGVVSFGLGQTSAQITILVAGDITPEADETFGLTLSASATAYATIRNDDMRPMAFVTANATSVREGGNVVFTVGRSGNTAVASTVQWAIIGENSGAAGVNSADFTSAMTGNVSFTAGQTTPRLVTVNVVNDHIAEYGEGFRFALTSSNSNPALDADVSTTAGAASVSIQDTSVPDFAISPAQIARNEGNSGSIPFIYTVTRTGDLTTAMSVGWDVIGSGTNAANTADFANGSLPTGSVSFAAGASSATLTVAVQGDTTGPEPSESFDVVLRPTTGATLSTDQAHGIIVNDDGVVVDDTRATARWITGTGMAAAPSGVTALSVPVSDFVGTLLDVQDYYRFRLDAAKDIHLSMTGLSGNADVVLQDSNGSPTLPGAYISSSTWSGNHDEAIDVSNLDAGDYYVRVYQNSGDTNYNLNLTATAPQRGTLSFNSASSAIATMEGNSGTTDAVFTVNRAGGTGSATVDWALNSSIPSLNGADFSGGAFPSGTLAFADGVNSATITVGIAGDTLVETDEYYSITLSNASNAVLDLSHATASGTIRNDDIAQAALPTVSIQATDANQLESNIGATDFVFTVTRSGDLSNSSSVNWGVTGLTADESDFVDGVLPTGTVSFNASQASQDITVQVQGDTLAEGNEAFAVSLSAPTGARLNPSGMVAGGIIRNDDTPTTFAISAADADKAEGDSGSTPFTFTVSRTGDISAAASVNWTLANLTSNNSDFSGGIPSGMVSLGAGIPSQDITIMVAGDRTIEQDERFLIQLTNAVDGGIDPVNGTAAGTIRNDDQQNVFGVEAVDTIQQEANSGATDFTFNLTSSSGSGTVNWQVGGFSPDLDGEDFVGGAMPSGTVNFTTGVITYDTPDGGTPRADTSFTPGLNATPLTIQVAGDYMAENDEMFQVSLDTASGGQIDLSNGMAMGAILDDDTFGNLAGESVVSVSIPAVDSEKFEGNTGTTNFVFNVYRYGDMDYAANVNWLVTSQSNGIAAADFAPWLDSEGIPGVGLPNGTITFSANESSATVTVGIQGDSLPELNEAFALVVEPASRGGLPDHYVVISDTSGAARAVILNDDTPPEVSITALDADKAEGDSGATAFVFRVARAGNLSAASTVNWAVASNFGTASANDFIGAPTNATTWRPSGTVSFGIGDAADKFVTVNVQGDRTVEADEIFRVNLTTPVNAVFAATGRTAFGQIRTDDLTSSTISRVAIEAPSSPVQDEGNSGTTPYVFTLRRSGDLTSSNVAVAWAVTGTGANAAVAADFQNALLPTGTATFAAGHDTVDITINVLADNMVEADKTFAVNINSVTNGEIIAANRVAQGIIRNDDVMTDVRVERMGADGSVLTDMSVIEGTSATVNTPTVYRISRDAGTSTGTLGWSVNLYGQSASITDFVGGAAALSGAVSFNNNTPTFSSADTTPITRQYALVTVSVRADSSVESNETFAFQLNATPGVSFDPNGQQLAMRIIDDDDDYGSSTTRFGSLTLGSGAIGGILPSGDQDWFKVTLAANTRYEFAIGSPDFAPVLRLMNANGNQLVDNAQDGTGTDSVRDGLTILSYTTGTIGGDYFISAQAANGGIGTYGIQANVAGRDDYASSSATLGRLNTDGTRSLGRIETAGDVDWFKATLASSTIYQFSAQATNGLSGGRLRLLDATGVTLASGDIANGGSFEYRTTTASTAYLAVDDISVTDTGTGLYAVAARVLSSTDATVVPTIDIVATADSSQLEGNPDPSTLTTIPTTNFLFQVNRSGNTEFASTAAWSIAAPGTNGFATLASDFSGATSGTVAFAAGETSATLTIGVRGDTLAESDERFTVNLATPTNAILGTTSAIGLIRNDDALPEVSIRTLTASASEGTTTLTTNPPITPFLFEVTRSNNSGTSTVNWIRGSYDSNVTNTDFNGASTGVVTFTPGSTSQTITINVAQDSIEENGESFYVRLATPTNAVLGNNQATASIANDDFSNHLAVQAVDAIKNEGNNGFTPFTFTVLRNGDLSRSNVAVNWAVTGTGVNAAVATDFQGALLPTGTITFGANEASRDIVINVAGNFDFAADKSFAVTLSNVQNAALDVTQATGTILNDDLPVVSISSVTASANEGNAGTTSNRVFTLTRASALGGDLNNVSWGVVLADTIQPDASDFTGATSGTVNFTGTQLTQAVTVGVAGDSTVEADETMLVNIMAGNNYVVSGTAGTASSVIVNDDGSSGNPGNYTGDNTQADAVSIGTLTSATDRVLHNWVGDTDTQDYYAFTVSATSSFALTLNGLDAAANADVQLLDASGNAIGGSYASGNSADSINLSSLAAGDYIARIYQYSGDTNYTLTMRATTLTETANNAATASGARNIGTLTGTPQVFNGSVASNDSDYYRFTTTDEHSNFRLSLTGLTDNADVYLLSSDGQTVMASAMNIGTAAESISKNNLARGNYYVWVSPMVAAVGDSTPYTLTLSAETTTEDDRSVNTFAQVTSGTPPAPVTFNATTGAATAIIGAVGSTDRNDYYRFNTTDVRNFSLALTGMTADADVQLLNTSGIVVGESHHTGSANETFSVNNLAAATYYVRVYQQSGNTNYTLNMTAAALALPADNDGTAALGATATNNSLSNVLGTLTSTPVVRQNTLGFAARPYTGETIDNGIDSNDWYKFTLGAASRIEVSLSDLSSDANVSVYSTTGSGSTLALGPLVVPTGTTTPTTNPTGTDAEFFTTNSALAAGIYYVQVNSADSIGTGYRLALRTLSGSDTGYDTTDNGNSTTQSANITYGSTGAASYNTTLIPAAGLTGFVGTSDSNDYYRFTTTATRNFTLNLRNLNANADVQLLNWTDSNHNNVVNAGETTVIAGSYAAGSTSDSITVNNLAAGTYYARVYQVSGDTNYSLSMSATTAPLPTDTDGITANATAITLSNGTWTSAAGQNIGFAAQAATGTVLGSDTDGIDSNDYYKFTLASGSSFVQVAMTGLTANAEVEVLDANGNLVLPDFVLDASGTPTATRQAHAIGASPETFTTNTSLGAGDYYVHVLSPEGASAGTNYSVSLRTFTDDYIATVATTGLIGTPGVAPPTTPVTKATGKIDAIGDVDWFAVTLTVGRTYTIRQYNAPVAGAVAAQTLNDSYIRGIYDSTGLLLDSSSNDDCGALIPTVAYMDASDSQVVFTATTTGTYYIAAGAYGSNIGTYTVSVAERTNLAPAVSNAPVTQTAMEGQAFSYRMPWNTFTDPEGQAMTYTATLGDGSLLSETPASNWLHFDADSQMFYGTPTANSPDLNIRVTATDPGIDGNPSLAGDNLSTSLSFMLNTPTLTDDFRADFRTTGRIVVGDSERSSARGAIETANDQDWFRVSLASNPTSDRIYVIDLRRTDGAGRLSDPYFRGIYSYDVTNNTTALIAGTTNDDANGSPNSQVRFTVAAGAATRDYFISAGGFGRQTGAYIISVAAESNTNHAPAISQTSAGIAAQTAYEGQAWRFTIPSTVFTDADTGSNGQLTYSAELSNGSALPAWLRFDAATRTFSSVNASGASANVPTRTNDLSILLTARDGGGLTVSDTFALSTPVAQTNVAGSGHNNWTIMVYMAADNNLDSYALKDLNEMESVTLPSGVKVVFMLDRLGANNSYRGVVTTDANLNAAASLTTAGNRLPAEVNSGDPSTLRDFIDWSASNYTADHYGLVVWDHGGGLSGTSWDTNTGVAGQVTNLSVADTTAAIRSSVLATRGLDMVGFDTCLQGMVEQAYDLRNVTQYVVASQNLEPGDGWDYASWLQTIAANPGSTAENVATAAVDTFGAFYNHQETLAAVNTGLNTPNNANDGLISLRDAINNFVNAAAADPTQTVALRNARTGVTNYNNSNYLDLGAYMANVATATSGSVIATTGATIATRAAEVSAALTAAVVATTNVAGIGDSGLSIFLPGITPGAGYTASQFQFVNDSNWNSYINTIAA